MSSSGNSSHQMWLTSPRQEDTLMHMFTSIKIRNEMKGDVGRCRDGKLVKIVATRHCHYCSDSK